MTQFPQININGSHPQQLLDQYYVAVEAVGKAIQAVRKIECHGRDYQTISGGDAASLAMREKQNRLANLDLIWNELQAILNNVAEQVEERERRRVK